MKQNPVFQDLLNNHKIQIKKGSEDYYYPYDLIAKGYCPCLDPELKICIIYPDRPSNCKSFFCEEATKNSDSDIS